MTCCHLYTDATIRDAYITGFDTVSIDYERLLGALTIVKTDEGQEFKENVKVSLMSDDDIIYLMKNVFPNELSAEYFQRVDRRHRVWKSEAEYKTFFLGRTSGGEILREFEMAMTATAKYLGGRSDIWTINQELADVIEAELAEIDNQKLDDMSKAVQKKDKEKILKVVNCLQKYAFEKNMKCDFIIIKASQFNSGFGKPDFSDTNISFPIGQGEEKVAKVGEIVSSLSAKIKDRDDFFYLFYKRDARGDIELESQELCKILMKEFV